MDYKLSSMNREYIKSIGLHKIWNISWDIRFEVFTFGIRSNISIISYHDYIEDIENFLRRNNFFETDIPLHYVSENESIVLIITHKEYEYRDYDSLNNKSIYCDYPTFDKLYTYTNNKALYRTYLIEEITENITEKMLYIDNISSKCILYTQKIDGLEKNKYYDLQGNTFDEYPEDKQTVRFIEYNDEGYPIFVKKTDTILKGNINGIDVSSSKENKYI